MINVVELFLHRFKNVVSLRWAVTPFAPRSPGGPIFPCNPGKPFTPRGPRPPFGPRAPLRPLTPGGPRRPFFAMSGVYPTTSPAGLLDLATNLKRDISDFRDYQIAHHKSPRTLRGTLFDPGEPAAARMTHRSSIQRYETNTLNR